MKHSRFKIQESSEYSVDLCEGVTFTPLKGKEPNLFHRTMQRLILGFKWKKNS